jgi:epoxyqueuosine reductase
MPLSAAQVKQAALDAGFDLAGIASAEPASDYARYRAWVESGMAGEMGYLTDHRGELRADARNLLPAAKTILCVGKRYNSPYPYSTDFSDAECGWISRYAWGADYHDVLKTGLTRVAEKLTQMAGHPFEWRVCVDTAPLLERSYARLAGLGWIGRNTCLIHERHGSWFFLGELLLGLDLQIDSPPPDRCGSCRRCIDACPTAALVPDSDGNWSLDARRCISYLTIEKRGEIAAELQPEMGRHIFGCDICQDVCPWNRRERLTGDRAFFPRAFAPPLAELARIEEDEFRRMFRNTPVWRAKYRGLLRNVAIAMGNAGRPEFLPLLGKLAEYTDPAVALAAKLAIERIESSAARPA